MMLKIFFQATTCFSTWVDPFKDFKNINGDRSLVAENFKSIFKNPLKSRNSGPVATNRHEPMSVHDALGKVDYSTHRFPNCTLLFTLAIHQLLTAYSLDHNENNQEAGKEDLEVMITGAEHWSPFTMTFMLAVPEADPETGVVIVDPDTMETVEEFFETLDNCAPDHAKVTQTDKFTFRISATHPDQLYEMIRDFVDETQIDTLDYALTRSQPQISFEGVKLELKTAWERNAYTKAQLERIKDQRREDMLTMEEMGDSELLNHLRDDALDHMPPRSFLSREAADLTGWVMSEAHYSGCVSLEGLKYAVLVDTRQAIPAEHLLRTFH